MDRGLKVLVVGTCLAVLVALAWWAWTGHAERAAANEAAHWANVDAQCNADLEKWGRGERAGLIARFGSEREADRALADCLSDMALRPLGYDD